MYKIIGADQREYGPVQIEQVRRWIAEGRANGQTKAWSEAGNEWKTLSDFPEFADALRARSALVQPSPPRIGTSEAEKLAAEIIARDYSVDIGDCFSRSWNLVRDNFWLLVGAAAVSLLLGNAVTLVPAVGIPAAACLAMVFQGGLQWLFLKRVRGEPADIGGVFAGFSLAFVPLLLAGIVVHVLVGIGLVLCIVPGIYLLVAWRLFVPLLVLDKGMEFWPAMELSRKVVTKHWWQCFGLFLLVALVGLFGLLGCFVGVFFTLPIAVGATVYAYQDIFGSRAAISELPAPPKPDRVSPATPAPTPSAPADASPTPPAPAAAPEMNAALAAPLESSNPPSPPSATPAQGERENPA